MDRRRMCWIAGALPGDKRNRHRIKRAATTVELAERHSMSDGRKCDAKGQRLRPRFGLRTLLVFVALIALTLVVGRQWLLLRYARFEFDRACALWKADRVLVDDVELAAKNLFERESATLWIGRRSAVRRQADRLRDLAHSLDALSRTRLYGSRDGSERDQQHAEALQRAAEELLPSNNKQD